MKLITSLLDHMIEVLEYEKSDFIPPGIDALAEYEIHNMNVGDWVVVVNNEYRVWLSAAEIENELARALRAIQSAPDGRQE